jgi:hypothetical protein
VLHPKGGRPSPTNLIVLIDGKSNNFALSRHGQAFYINFNNPGRTLRKFNSGIVGNGQW